MSGKNILVICDKAFEAGFRLLEDNSFKIQVFDKNSIWNRLSLINKIKSVRNIHVVHYFWARSRSIEVMIMILLRKRVILHFIGSDVLQTLKNRRKTKLLSLWQKLGVIIIADSESLQQELAHRGIQAKVVHFLNRKIEDHEQPYPISFSAVSYIPENKEMFYGIDAIKYCAQHLPEIDFTIINNNKDFGQPNIHAVGRVPDIIEELNKHSVYIRMTKHDGLAVTVLEALTCARYVVWTQRFPHCHYAETKEELLNALLQIRKNTISNKQGKEYVLQNFNNMHMQRQYSELWGIEHAEQSINI